MFRRASTWTCLIALAAAGCAESTPPAASSTPAPTAMTPPSGAGGAGPSMSMPMMPNFTPEDQQMISKQAICPVGGEKLGSMGAPVKVTVKDRTVFLCCASCKEAIEKDPDKYLAKLDGAAAAPGTEAPAATTEGGTPAAETPEAPAAEAPAAEEPKKPE